MSGELKKMLIEAYDDLKFRSQDFVDEYEVLFNPTGYSEKYEIEYAKDQAPGTSGVAGAFGKVKPQEYSFELLIDGTGTSSVATSVTDEVEWLLSLVFRYQGEQHRPNYLKISWGRLVTRCILKSATVNYTLFDSDGNPLRAKIQTVFSEIADDELRAARENRRSPDLTHYRTVNDGDTLPLMTQKIYGDMSHYLRVAQYNNLVNFRSLETGTQIAFPPLKDLLEPTKG